MPKDNEKDMADVPEQLRKVMKLHFVESMDEVLGIALEGPLPELKEETPEVLASVQPPPPEHRPHQ
jgi:ATP-dependent Lon protease